MKYFTTILIVMCLTSCSKVNEPPAEYEWALPTPGATGVVKFEQLFKPMGSGQYMLRHSIRIAGLGLGKGIEISDSINFNGIRINKIRNKMFKVSNQGGVLVIQETL